MRCEPQNGKIKSWTPSRENVSLCKLQGNIFRLRIDILAFIDAANDIFASVQLYQRIIGYAEVDGLEIDFETLIYDSVARVDPDTRQMVAGNFKPRKAKPIRGHTKPSNEVKSGDSNSRLTPRVQEAW